MHNCNLSTDPIAAKYCQVNIKTSWLLSLVTSWFYLFWGGGSFPTAQIQQSYQAICPPVYTVSILSLLMPLFSIHHTLKWNTPSLQGSFQSTRCLKPSSWLGFSLPTPAWKEPLSSLQWLLHSFNIHFCLVSELSKVVLVRSPFKQVADSTSLASGRSGAEWKTE